MNQNMPKVEHTFFESFADFYFLNDPYSSSTILKSVDGIADWLDRASEATGEPRLCYRTAIYHIDGRITWLFPRSNTSELIHAWIDVADLLNDRSYIDRAESYALRMIEDPECGIYHGEHKEAHGLMWYWRDDGSYTGGYSMRVPGAFKRLYELNGDQRFLDASVLIGETFLKRQLPSGIVNMVGWSPERGWFYEDVIGSRYVYSLATFASLYALTGESAYEEAYEKSVHALQQMQQPNGSFFQLYDPVTLLPVERSIKIHFFSYIFNALEEAYAIFKDPRLIDCAESMCDYLAGVFYYRRQLPYCLDAEDPSDLVEADSAVQDCASGLLWLHQVNGNLIALDLGIKLWREGMDTQIKSNQTPGCHGAIVRAMNPGMTADAATDIPVAHLQFDPTRVGRCEAWFAANHIFAANKLLALVQASQSALTP